MLALILTSLVVAAPITQDELVHRTQELADAVAPGNAGPWKKYYADDAIYSDEKGRTLDKPALIRDMAPLPKGYSGHIRIVNPQSRILGDVAVLGYDMDESETIYGQELHARYHQTDTWVWRNGAWQIVASQAMRYYEDPAPGKIDPGLLNAYVGTYQLAPGVTMEVTRDGGRLFAERKGRAREELVPEAAGIFFRRGVEGRRLFRTGKDGKVDALVDRRNNEDVVWTRVR